MSERLPAAERDERVRSILALVPELHQQLHALHREGRRGAAVVMPAHLDPGSAEPGDLQSVASIEPLPAARLLGMPVVWVPGAAPTVVAAL